MKWQWIKNNPKCNQCMISPFFFFEICFFEWNQLNQIWKVHWIAFPQAVKLSRRLSASAVCDNFFLSGFLFILFLGFRFGFALGSVLSFFFVLSFALWVPSVRLSWELSAFHWESMCFFVGILRVMFLQKGRELFWNDDLVLLIVAFS
jgi:hypothetical protein